MSRSFNHDLDFKLISGRFDRDVPPQYQYLFKYFRPGLGRSLLGYYFGFNQIYQHNQQFFCECFVDHTGFHASSQRILFLVKKIQKLIFVAKTAEENFDLETLSKVKQGKFYQWQKDV